MFVRYFVVRDATSIRLLFAAMRRETMPGTPTFPCLPKEMATFTTLVEACCHGGLALCALWTTYFYHDQQRRPDSASLPPDCQSGAKNQSTQQKPWNRQSTPPPPSSVAPPGPAAASFLLVEIRLAGVIFHVLGYIFSLPVAVVHNPIAYQQMVKLDENVKNLFAAKGGDAFNVRAYKVGKGRKISPAQKIHEQRTLYFTVLQQANK